jgi:hypothetical protein
VRGDAKKRAAGDNLLRRIAREADATTAGDASLLFGDECLLERGDRAARGPVQLHFEWIMATMLADYFAFSPGIVLAKILEMITIIES